MTVVIEPRFLIPTGIEGRYARFLPIAKAFAAMSKDPSTKVGAVILGPAREVRSSGWNGAPIGSKADEDHRAERPEKYHWVSHAEMNAIALAARQGVSVEGCVMVVTHPPCMICARLIVQAGIVAVVSPEPDEDFRSRWQEEMDRAEVLFKEAFVTQVLVPKDFQDTGFGF